MFRLPCSLLLICLFQVCLVTAKWPEYNQQCRDDAGPPFMDDAPPVRYHDGSSAVPIVEQNGDCVPKMKKACAESPSIKAAYLEGPLDCGDKGWYCRIMPDPDNWAPVGLTGDVNFAHCNSTYAFDDEGSDQDGHCHGSSHDSTYYWWIRDHWHRQYNGNIRCCCGWFLGSSSQPMYERRIGNRCDYRREVDRTEDLEKCRDANEDHGKSFDDTNTKDEKGQEYGCDPQFKSQINKPIPEDDDLCWEIRKFGYVDGDENSGDGDGDGDGDSDEDEDDEDSGDGDGDGDGDSDEDSDEDEIECYQEPMDKFFFKPKKNKNGEVVGAKRKTCKWLDKKSKKKGNKHKKQVKKICKRKNGYENDDKEIYVDPARDICMVTCQTCDGDEDENEE